MTSMRFIVPRSRRRVESKLSFIFSASAEDSRISSPIATVIYHPTVSSSTSNNPWKGVKLTSFNTLTLPRIPSTCASFWLSSSLSTASLYWPLLFGVAERNEPGLDASKPPCPRGEGEGAPYPP
ncbi:hypothetical protein FOXG_20499 [Fusarium oxysporum f. sp. lycopersici 4287]|uniref:Uncharacterized protein n=1 Tax=Fusarium oxysporum f. sp. lycopersici (strain 4287 / CBS 123668 / FGSC 9935 / NRRL 34936) TaxID=426428 RepID=A0A0J9VKU9_FUSO4|nr:hypothetical protein FOXG_20499 [Fusarium oxysporum f. sp. lycopersici 4287]KAI8419234.1 hypothetical protein FOFC_01811 [Fusarium oxysporum]KNB11351.1 hypothetical protein FOXG_20499 [Fusarium oxysporum f. sp. lycopersici 4287]